MDGIKTRNRIGKSETNRDYLEELKQGEQRIQETNAWAMRTFLAAKHTQSEMVKFMSSLVGMELV